MNTEDDAIYKALLEKDTEIRYDALKKCIEDNPASVKSDNDDRPSPLLQACEYGYPDCVLLLLKAGASAEEYNSIQTCFYDDDVESEARLQCVRLLLDHGANIYEGCQLDVTPLMCACHFLDINTVKEILDRGYNKSGAMSSNDEDDTDINTGDHEGETAMLHCINSEQQSGDHVSCLKLLIAAGAAVNAEDGSYSASSRPLWNAITSLPRSLSLVETLLEAGAKVIKEDLFLAVKALNLNLIKLFLRQGLDIEQRDRYLCSPLLVLIDDIPRKQEIPPNDRREKIENCLKYLIDEKADIHVYDKNKHQPIHYVLVLWPFYKFPAEFLISENCDLSKLTLAKVTSVRYIVQDSYRESYQRDMVKFLFECGLSNSLCQSFIHPKYPDVEDWIQKVTRTPRSLVSLCTFDIRRCLGLGIKAKCEKLQVTHVVKDILLLKHLLSKKCFD